MSHRLVNWFKLSSPVSFYPVAGKLIPWFWILAALFGAAGLWLGFFVGAHGRAAGARATASSSCVPASWMSMFIYVVMAFWAGMGMAFNTRLSSMVALALAPTGALMAFLSLWTGALWGKPMWGAWWVWDARLTSGADPAVPVPGLHGAARGHRRARRADRAAAVLALVGVVNVPIIYFSVKWWNTCTRAPRSRSQGPLDGTDHALGHVVDGPVFLDVFDHARHSSGCVPLSSNARRIRTGCCSLPEAA